MIVVGIDPGITGGIALVDQGEPIEIVDMPIMAKLHGTGSQVNPYELTSILMEWRPNLVAVERVSNAPGEGSTSSFSFGHGVGIIHGIVAALGYALIQPTPGMWKKRAGLLKQEKDKARTLCIQRYPGLSDQLTRKKDIGRADAILIAVYGYEKESKQ